MDRLTTIKAAVSAAAAALTAFWGWTGWLAAAWFLAMLLDYATGSAAALRAGTWSSRCAREGLWHKAGSVAGVLVSALLDFALRALLGSIQPGDFFALNAFLPFTGEGRREALEDIRHGVGESRHVASCLEVGPRYLHSTGQLQKGGPNCGVFLILSADELKDIPLKREAESLGALAKAQASGDLLTLASRGRRCVHLHLPDNSGVTLRALAAVIREILAEL